MSIYPRFVYKNIIWPAQGCWLFNQMDINFFFTKSSEYYGGNRDKFCRHFTPRKSVKHTHSSSKLQQSSFVEYSNANNHFQAVFKTETAVIIWSLDLFYCNHTFCQKIIRKCLHALNAINNGRNLYKNK